MLTVTSQERDTPATLEPGGSVLDEIVREGARRMLAAALEAEVAAYVGEHTDQLDEDGRRLVVRNGRHQARQVLTSPGAIEVVAPRVNDKRVDAATGERARFSSAILAPWCRKSPQISLMTHDETAPVAPEVVPLAPLLLPRDRVHVGGILRPPA